MIQNNKVNINNIRKYCADYVHVVKDPKTASDQVVLAALMIFELIMEEIYGNSYRKEMMDMVEEKQKNEKTKASKIIKP